MKFLSMRKYAEIHAVTHQAVTKWKKRGWLVFEGDKVNVEKSNARLKRYRAAGINEGQPTVKPVVAGETSTQTVNRMIAGILADVTMDLKEARRVKETYLALLAQLEYETKSAQVVMAADVTREVGEEYAKARTRLLRIASEVAPKLRRMKTVAEVQDALSRAITEALEDLTKEENRSRRLCAP